MQVIYEVCGGGGGGDEAMLGKICVGKISICFCVCICICIKVLYLYLSAYLYLYFFKCFMKCVAADGNEAMLFNKI